MTRNPHSPIDLLKISRLNSRNKDLINSICLKYEVYECKNQNVNNKLPTFLIKNVTLCKDKFTQFNKCYIIRQHWRYI